MSEPPNLKLTGVSKKDNRTPGRWKVSYYRKSRRLYIWDEQSCNINWNKGCPSLRSSLGSKKP